ncbi:MAG: hypothetical protein AB1505_32440, partial [Candidatus Latescibacterota bacterium]
VVHLDVSFEVTREPGAEDGELPVSFVHEGEEHVRSTLSRARSVLQRQVSAYCEQQAGWLEEKKEALERMFAGQQRKPAVPQIPDRLFELPVTWLEVEVPAEMEVSTVLSVSAREPRRLTACTTARLREPRRGGLVVLRAQGARGTFSFSAEAPATGSWQSDPAVRDELAALAVAGVTALELVDRLAR